jgi:hypothetical protein
MESLLIELVVGVLGPWQEWVGTSHQPDSQVLRLRYFEPVWAKTFTSATICGGLRDVMSGSFTASFPPQAVLGPYFGTGNPS